MEHPGTDILQRYADNLLETDLRRSIQGHINSCDRCRRIVALEHALMASLRNPPSSAPSPHFDRNVLNALRAQQDVRKGTRVSWFTYAAAAALIATTLVVLIVAGASGDEQSRSVLTPVFEKVSSVTLPVLELLVRQSARVTPHLDEGGIGFVRIFLIAMSALLVFGGLERFIFPSIRHDSKL